MTMPTDKLPDCVFCQINEEHTNHHLVLPSDNKEQEYGYIKVRLDYAPKTNGKKFAKWCEQYGFDPLGSGRRAWCSDLRTYFRDASGVAFNDGEMFLFYEDDIVDIEALIADQCRLARIEVHQKYVAHAKLVNNPQGDKTIKLTTLINVAEHDIKALENKNET